MSGTFSVAVLVSEGRNPVSGASRAARADAAALALAQSLAGADVRVLYAGNPATPALGDYLALGARCIEVVPVAEGDDAVPPLAAAIASADLVLTGARSERGAGSGMLPHALAHVLARPVITNVLSAKSCGDGKIEVEQFLPKGARRRLAVPPHAVLAVHPMAPERPKHVYARRLSGRIKALPSAEVSAVAAPDFRAIPVIEPLSRPLRKLTAHVAKDGFERMRDLIEPKAKSGVVAFEGSSVDKAQVILNYLRQHRLVEF